MVPSLEAFQRDALAQAVTGYQRGVFTVAKPRASLRHAPTGLGFSGTVCHHRANRQLAKAQWPRLSQMERRGETGLQGRVQGAPGPLLWAPVGRFTPAPALHELLPPFSW